MNASDKRGINPHYRVEPKVRLYNLKRAENAERTTEFQDTFIANQRRSKKLKTFTRKGSLKISAVEIWMKFLPVKT